MFKVPRASLKRIDLYASFAWLIITILVFLAIRGIWLDPASLGSLQAEGWYGLLEKEYIKNLIISPLWVLVGFLFSRSMESKNVSHKRKEERIFGLIKNKEEVSVLDLREILQDVYDQDEELKKLLFQRDGLKNKAQAVSDAELKV